MTNATTNVNKVLESLILVSLSEIHGISGRKKLKREDFGIGVDLPPDVIVSLGSKKVIDPKLLNPFTQYKTKAHSLCSAVGIRFLGGYAVPADRVNDLISALNDVKTEFYIYKKVFLQSDFDSWINNCEEKYQKILRDGACVDLEYMDSQIQFGFTAIHITPYGNSVIQDGIAGQIKSLTDEVFEEVSGLVDGFLKNLNPNAFTQHTINPLRRTADKLASLGFISDSVNKLSVYMAEVLNDVPASGKVTGRKYSDILSLLNNLRDPQRAKSFVDLLGADSTVQPTDNSDFIDLSGSAGIVSSDPVAPDPQPIPVVTRPTIPVAGDCYAIDISSPDCYVVGTSSYISDDNFYAESTSMAPAPDLPKAPEIEPAHSIETQATDSVDRIDDSFATDLPSGNEVINEPVIEVSPTSVTSEPIVDDAAPNTKIEGFRNVVVVDETLFGNKQVSQDFTSLDAIEVDLVKIPDEPSVSNSVISPVFNDQTDGILMF
ncbi:DUF3150 domain-containing protein [Xenorhabdus sp. KJ12.1]|uniref:DUF3150 domain-containing protein n=1 Tax=Xenorhabdus sp. KJ12.1 TaxID=1851571 RepID=UPI000C03A88F|nr:DUF3150 domain-containing protein [Xenorhabdus sp. KJ12.1]PHM72208.1 cobalamin biosynthesis protein [Xenorhabdus sp. KJ12.1]